jgi:hypothetical protein
MLIHLIVRISTDNLKGGLFGRARPLAEERKLRAVFDVGADAGRDVLPAGELQSGRPARGQQVWKTTGTVSSVLLRLLSAMPALVPRDRTLLSARRSVRCFNFFFFNESFGFSNRL